MRYFHVQLVHTLLSNRWNADHPQPNI